MKKGKEDNKHGSNSANKAADEKKGTEKVASFEKISDKRINERRNDSLKADSSPANSADKISGTRIDDKNRIDSLTTGEYSIDATDNLSDSNGEKDTAEGVKAENQIGKKNRIDDEYLDSDKVRSDEQ